jgi:hypothetical protein
MWFWHGLLMRWLSLFLACQHLRTGTNLRECEDQSWFKVQAVPVFRLDLFFRVHQGYAYLWLETWNYKRVLGDVAMKNCKNAPVTIREPPNGFPWNLVLMNFVKRFLTYFCFNIIRTECEVVPLLASFPKGAYAMSFLTARLWTFECLNQSIKCCMYIMAP